MVGKGTHIKDLSMIKRARYSGDGQQHDAASPARDGEAAAGSRGLQGGATRRRIEHGHVNSGGAKFVVGVGADDMDEDMLGEGTKRLLELLWTMRDDEFEKMTLANEKHPCPNCGRKTKIYCEKCVLRVGDSSRVPNVELPLEIAVIQHSSENKNKSTAAYASLVSPSVNIYTYPGMPDHMTPHNSVVLFPATDACQITDISVQDWSNIRHAIAIDSTWITCNQILTDPRLAGMRKVVIAQEQTTFWRYHNHGETCLSTLECIYHFARQYARHTRPGCEDLLARVEALVFYYAHFYRSIQRHYLLHPDREFYHKNNYIKYERAEQDCRELGIDVEQAREQAMHRGTNAEAMRLAAERQSVSGCLTSLERQSVSGCLTSLERQSVRMQIQHQVTSQGQGSSDDDGAGLKKAEAGVKHDDGAGSKQRGERSGEGGGGLAPVDIYVGRVDVGANKLAKAILTFRAPEGVQRVDLVQIDYDSRTQKAQRPLYWVGTARDWHPWVSPSPNAGVRLATCIKRISSTTQRDPVRLRIKSDAGAAWSSWSSEYELPGEMLIEVKGVHCPFTQP